MSGAAPAGSNAHYRKLPSSLLLQLPGYPHKVARTCRTPACSAFSSSWQHLLCRRHVVVNTSAQGHPNQPAQRILFILYHGILVEKHEIRWLLVSCALAIGAFTEMCKRGHACRSCRVRVQEHTFPVLCPGVNCSNHLSVSECEVLLQSPQVMERLHQVDNQSTSLHAELENVGNVLLFRRELQSVRLALNLCMQFCMA